MPPLSGAATFVADMTNKGRLDLFTIYFNTSLNRSCIKYNFNQGSLNETNIGLTSGSQVVFNTTYYPNDICLFINQSYSLLQVMAFDFGLTQTLDLFVTLQYSNETNYRNLLFFGVGQQQYNRGLFFNTSESPNFYNPIEIQQTDAIPQALQLSNQSVPDLVYVNKNNNIVVLLNNVTNAGSQVQGCIDSPGTCFNQQFYTLATNYTIMNNLYQIDLNGECIPELQILVDSMNISQSDLNNYNTLAVVNGFAALSSNSSLAYQYLLTVSFNKGSGFSVINQTFLGQNITAPTFYDIAQNGSMSIVFTSCRNVNVGDTSCSAENSVQILYNVQALRQHQSQCTKQTYTLNRVMFNISSLVSQPISARLFISDYIFNRTCQLFAIQQNSISIFQINATNNTQWIQVQNIPFVNQMTNASTCFIADFNTLGQQLLVVSNVNQTIFYQLNITGMGSFAALQQLPQTNSSLNLYVPGVTFQFSVANMQYSNYLTAGQLMSQGSYQFMQLPVFLTGTETQKDYLDYVFSGNPQNNTQSDSNGVIPNSRVISQLNQQFTIQLPQVYVSEIVVSAIAIALLCIFMIVVGCLWCKEQREDRADQFWRKFQ